MWNVEPNAWTIRFGNKLCILMKYISNKAFEEMFLHLIKEYDTLRRRCKHVSNQKEVRGEGKIQHSSTINIKDLPWSHLVARELLCFYRFVCLARERYTFEDTMIIEV